MQKGILMSKRNKPPQNNKPSDDAVPTDTLAQTENFVVWASDDEGETVYHVELDVLTLHFYAEDWDELVTLIKDAEFARKNPS
jgi:hypothetical protein